MRREMTLLIEPIEYKRLLELKFKLKRKAHMTPLTPLENILLNNCERKLEINNKNAQYLMNLAQNPDLMVG